MPGVSRSRWPPGTTATRTASRTACRRISPIRPGSSGKTVGPCCVKLTLNLGARYAHAVGFIPEQCRRASEAPLDTVYPAQCFPRIDFRTWNSIVPRLHAAFDVAGDDKTVIKGGWGRFAHNWHSDELQMANENVHLSTLLPVARPQQQQAVRSRRDQLRPEGIGLRVHEPLHRRRRRARRCRVQPDHQGADEQRVLALARARADAEFRRARDGHLFAAAGLPGAEQPAAVRRVHHSDHNPDPGPDGRVGTADDPGESDHLLRLSRRLPRAKFPAADAHQRHVRRRSEVTRASSSRRASDLTGAGDDGVLLDDENRSSALAEHGEHRQRLHQPGLQVFLATFDPERGDQHRDARLGMDRPARGCVHPAADDAGVGELRTPQRSAVGADRVTSRRRRDSRFRRSCCAPNASAITGCRISTCCTCASRNRSAWRRGRSWTCG